MREVCPALSHFMTTFCLQELTFGTRYRYCVDSEPESPGELVNGDIQPLWLDGMYAYQGAKYSFFLCGRDLMIMRTDFGVPVEYWLACNKEETVSLLATRHKIRRTR
jgi:hypothetical protein